MNVGEVVKLKSGGPQMTISRIEELNGAPHAVCAWFEGTKNNVGTFPVTSLEIYVAPARAQAGGKTGPWS